MCSESKAPEEFLLSLSSSSAGQSDLGRFSALCFQWDDLSSCLDINEALSIALTCSRILAQSLARVPRWMAGLERVEVEYLEWFPFLRPAGAPPEWEAVQRGEGKGDD